MCIIVYKPSNIDLPPREVLKTCFENNPDGVGFMYRYKNRILILKGYMDFGRFYTALKNANRIPGGLKETDLVVHFRIATHGSVVPGQTHPFPVSGKLRDLLECKFSSGAGLAHNGVLSDYAPDKSFKSSISDTMNFIWMNSTAIEPALEQVKCGSKFVLMTAAQTRTFGTFEQAGGVYFSNSSYRTAIYGGTSNFDSFDWGAVGAEYERRTTSDGAVYYVRRSVPNGNLPNLKYITAKTGGTRTSAPKNRKERRKGRKRSTPRRDDRFGTQLYLDLDEVETCFYCGETCDIRDMMPCEGGDRLICRSCYDEIIFAEYWEGIARDEITASACSLPKGVR